MSELAGQVRAVIPLIEAALADHFPARIGAAGEALGCAMAALVDAECSPAGLDAETQAARAELAPWMERFEALVAHVQRLRDQAQAWARSVSPSERLAEALRQLQKIIGSALAHPTGEEIASAMQALEKVTAWMTQHARDYDPMRPEPNETWQQLQPSIDRLRVLATESARRAGGRGWADVIDLRE